MVEDTSQFVGALRSLVEASDQVEIIAIMEFLAFLVVASQEPETWSGRLVFYVTDNQNVETWLKRRRPRNRAARRLVLLLQRFEAEREFSCHPTYIRTYRNELADWISRADPEAVRESLTQQGWTETPFQGEWRQIVEDARSGPLVLPAGPDDLSVVARPISCHPFHPAPRTLKVWLDSSWEVVLQGPPGFSSAVIAMAKHGLGSAGNSDRVWATLSQDPRGFEWAPVVERLTSSTYSCGD